MDREVFRPSDLYMKNEYLCATDEIFFNDWTDGRQNYERGRLVVAVKLLPKGKVVPYRVLQHYESNKNSDSHQVNKAGDDNGSFSTKLNDCKLGENEYLVDEEFVQQIHALRCVTKKMESLRYRQRVARALVASFCLLIVVFSLEFVRG
ncbi:uncharacterized protein LOC142336844 [Convolutriloba macropyga]|uniref:uncharacterized protein LOC142336844 n=1 Tax=Convolutriloba macropyga TaxID=536237 RepID=UPI003F520B12